MLSKDEMEKAQAYPGRYGEHFYSFIFVMPFHKRMVISASHFLLYRFANSLHLGAKENRLIQV